MACQGVDWRSVIGSEPEAFVHALVNGRPAWVVGSLSHSDARFLFRHALEAETSVVVEIGTLSGFLDHGSLPCAELREQSWSHRSRLPRLLL